LQVGEALRYMGEVLLKQGNIQKAENLMQKSLQIFENNGQVKYHPNYYLSLESLASLYEYKTSEAIKEGYIRGAEQHKGQAIHYLIQALIIAESIFSNDSKHVQRIVLRLQNVDSFMFYSLKLRYWLQHRMQAFKQYNSLLCKT
jgi:tetratricopeptide (TPR) repeat protein